VTPSGWSTRVTASDVGKSRLLSFSDGRDLRPPELALDLLEERADDREHVDPGSDVLIAPVAMDVALIPMIEMRAVTPVLSGWSVIRKSMAC